MERARDVKMSPFGRIAASFKVLDFARPVITVDPDTPSESILGDATLKDLGYPGYCIVKDDIKVYGYIEVLDLILELPGTSKGRAIFIDPNQLVSASTSLLELASLFSDNKKFFLVLVGNEITHSVNFGVLDSLQMKSCLFSLLLELETAAIDLLRMNPKVFLELLSEDRMEKARGILRRRKGSNSIEDEEEYVERLLYCTTLIDKKTMLRPFIKKKAITVFNSVRVYNNYFDKVESVRNQIAHSDSIWDVLSSPNEFKNFISTTHSFIAELIRVSKQIGT